MPGNASDCGRAISRTPRTSSARAARAPARPRSRSAGSSRRRRSDRTDRRRAWPVRRPSACEAAPASAGCNDGLRVGSGRGGFSRRHRRRPRRHHVEGRRDRRGDSGLRRVGKGGRRVAGGEAIGPGRGADPEGGRHGAGRRRGWWEPERTCTTSTVLLPVPGCRAGGRCVARGARRWETCRRGSGRRRGRSRTLVLVVAEGGLAAPAGCSAVALLAVAHARPCRRRPASGCRCISRLRGNGLYVNVAGSKASSQPPGISSAGTLVVSPFSGARRRTTTGLATPIHGQQQLREWSP